MSRDGTVLVVENETNMRRVLGTLLRRDGLHVLEAGDGQEALDLLGRERVDAVLTDLKMPRMNGLELLAEATRQHPGIPVVLLTAFGTVGSAVEALKKGAFDYLTKPFDPEELRQVLEKAVRTRALQESEATAPAGDSPESLMVGESRSLALVREVIERVAPTPATVLITGESGTGKELVARSLHARSPRRDAPFVKINCAAIPESLFESELFGYERGAFTGAGARKPGRFELADRGTLFLDEIGEMPLSTQPKLLRALQEGRFFRVGGTRVVSVDVRLVAATNRDLFAEVRGGRFREDLFYRLHVVPIHMPALRERREDIPALAALFVRRFARRLRKGELEIEPEAMAAMRLHEWPGNIRELENAIERALLLADARIRLRDLPAEVAAAAERARGCALGASLRELVRQETRRIEREAICGALAATGGNVTRAAAQLGLSRRGLQLKMKELDVRGRDCEDES
jgi:DNA-binding NtrC family response regulator